jgi:YD repeat-containing protein
MRRESVVKRLALLTVLIALAAPLCAQSADPNTERGVAQGKAYAYGNVDTINLFNGNLNAAIPIGQQYHVGGQLSYGLALNFGGNAWEGGHRTYHYTCWSGVIGISDPQDCTIDYDWSFPSRRSNAGFGWILSLGAVFQKDSAYITDWTYEAPDGSLHDLKATKVHSIDNNEGVTPNVYYSTDGTYLRFTIGSDYLQLEFPNGIIQTFDKSNSYPGSGKLKRIEDPYGNYLTVDYNDPQIPDATRYGGTTWHLHDSHGRDHYVYFKPVASYNELSSTAGGVVSHEAVAEVRLQTFNGARSSYIFHYEGEANSTWSTLTRPRAERRDPNLSDTTAATLLTSVVVPAAAQSSYAMTYDRDFLNGHESGALTSLTLPTQGKVVWGYQKWLLNNPAGTAAPAHYYPGVATRTVLDAAGVAISKTDYSQVLNDANSTIAPEEQTTVTVRSGDGSTILSRSLHYFSTCVTTRSPGGGPTVGKCTYPTGDYGLPFSRVPRTNVNPDATGTRFLSSQVLTPDANGNWTVPARTVYLRYEADKLTTPSFILDVNRRLASQRTIYEDGTIGDENYSAFDGLGHYRQKATGGTFGRADTRTTFTNFNPLVGTFTVQSNGTLAPGYSLGYFSRWILQTHNYNTVTETLPGASSSTTSMVQSCFDANGFLRRRRALKLPVSNPLFPPLDTTDVLAVFTPSAGGEIAREQYLGGDKGPAAPTDTCNGSVPGEAYRIDHTYSYGSVATSQYYDASGLAVTFKNVDQDIDQSTGFVKTSRERTDGSGSGLVTTYVYDALGRLTDVQPAIGVRRGSWTQFVYSMNPPRVDVYQRPNGGGTALTHVATQFDVLGRIWRESRDMPDGSTPVRETLYNGAGWKTSVSEEAIVPVNRTLFSYDPFGRPTTITAPDDSSVTLSYTGMSALQKTVGVRTAGDATVTSGPAAITNAVTTERYDRQGRLWKLTDPAGTVTEYTYDIDGRLSKVCMNLSGTTCGQTRLFNYDNRGFLASETHPEKGAAGNGSTQYFDYDARGHSTRRLEGASGGAFDLTFAYDRAERLKSVSLTSGRPLKTYDYGTSNNVSTGDYRNGQVTEAIRYNWFDALGYGIQMSELYTYAGKEGRVSARQTADYECLLSSGPCTDPHAGTKRTVFDQTFSYDDIGQITSLGYPACSHAGCGGVVPSVPTVTNGYSKGFLTSVTWTGSPAANTISYWPNGLINQVVHSNSVIDTQGLDPNGMRRPAYVTASGATDISSCTAPTITVPPASAQLVNGQAPLSVTVSADADTINHPLSYQWYLGASGQTGTPLMDIGPTATAFAAGSYWVRVSNNCGTVNSPAAIVTSCTAPAISSHPASRSITSGMQVTLTVTATGDTPTFQWYQGFSPNTASLMQGQTGSSLVVAPTTTSNYWVRVTNDCGTANSNTATVTVYAAPSTPTNVAADFSSGSWMTIVWTPPSVPAGLDHYEIQRASDGNGFAFVTSSSITYATDSSFTWGKACLYRVRAVDVNQVASPWSLADLATAFNFYDPYLDSNYAVRAIHISELRQTIDAVRQTASLPPQWFNYAPPTGSRISASNLTEMRTALDEARGILGLSPINYSNPGLSYGSPIVIWDMIELREGVK